MMRQAFTPTQLRGYRTGHDRTLTHRCDVQRVGEAEVDGYTQDAAPQPHLTDLPCTFMRVVPGYRRDDVDRAQVVAEPTVYVDHGTDIQPGDQIGFIRDELGHWLVAGWMDVKTVTVGQFSVTVTLREVQAS